MPKSCLRCPTPPSTPALGHHHARKCVAFDAEELEQVFAADEWDRTPTEAAQKLSYGDILELKAIQRSLPIARQLPDPLSRRQQTQYLSKVRIGLLPMYDANEGQLTNSVTVPPIYPSNPSSPAIELPPVPSRSPSLNGYVPSALSQSPLGSPAFSPAVLPPKGNIYAVRPKPGFTFLPLMDSPAPSAPTTPAPSVCSLPATPAPTPATPTPPSSEADDSDHDLSTPALSNASLDTTPSPREHPLELEGADSYFQLSPRLVTKKQKELNNPYFPPSSAYPSSTRPSATRPSCYTPGVRNPPSAPGVQFKRMLGTPFRPPPNPVSPREEDDDEEEGDFMIINGEKCHFGPSSTPPDSPVVAPAEAEHEEHDEVPLSPISPAQTTSALFAMDPSDQHQTSPSQELPPSISRAPPAPSIPVAPVASAYDSEPVIAPFCMQMKRRGAAIPS